MIYFYIIYTYHPPPPTSIHPPSPPLFEALKAATAELEETRRGVRAELQGSQAAERRISALIFTFFCWLIMVNPIFVEKKTGGK